MFFIIVMAILVIVLCIAAIVGITIYREAIKQWTFKMVHKNKKSLPDGDNPGSYANEIYAKDLGFNVLIVLYFSLATVIIIMLVIIAGALGFSILRAIF